MASEVSVDDVLEGSLPLLAVVIHGVGKSDDSGKSLSRAMQPLFEQLQRLLVTQDVRPSRGILHVLVAKRNHLLRNRASRRDRVHEHISVAWFRMNATRPEVCLDEFE